jgi:antitoxin component of MazEF toxin-antitoxin module
VGLTPVAPAFGTPPDPLLPAAARRLEVGEEVLVRLHGDDALALRPHLLEQRDEQAAVVRRARFPAPRRSRSRRARQAELAPAMCARAIRVYTALVKVVKVRRVGNSNVISIPREFEAHGYAPGTSVLVEELPGGELRIVSTEKVSERIREIGERVVAEHGEALQILADHDPDSTQD